MPEANWPHRRRSGERRAARAWHLAPPGPSARTDRIETPPQFRSNPWTLLAATRAKGAQADLSTLAFVLSSRSAVSYTLAAIWSQIRIPVRSPDRNPCGPIAARSTMQKSETSVFGVDCGKYT